MRRLLSVFYFFFYFFSSYAQEKTGSIAGLVTDQSAQPLPGVTISLFSLDHELPLIKAGSDSKGRYVFSSIKPGNYYLLASHLGYKPAKTETFIVSKGKVKVIEINLYEQTSQSLREVKVRALSLEEEEAQKVRNSVMPVTVITAKQIENRASDLNEILSRQAGIRIRQSGGLGSSYTISVRGLEGKRVQVFIDGNPLNTPDGSLGINDLPLQIIERIDIYKGAVPSWLGGDGLGSAVNIIIRHREVSYVDATLSYQSYNTKNRGLILKKTLEKQGIELGAGVFDVSSDNNYKMESPYQPGLFITRDHDQYHSLLAGASARFHKLWFDEIELEGAYINNRKQIQGIQQNIQHAESKGESGVIALNLRKDSLFNNKLSIRDNFIIARFDSRFSDTSSLRYNWDGSTEHSTYGRGELGIGPNNSSNLQREIRQRFNANYLLNSRFSLNLNNQFRYGKMDPRDDLGNEYAGKNLFNYPGDLQSSVTGFTLESRFMDDRLLLSTAAKHYYSRVTGFNTNIYVSGSPDKVNNTTSTFGYNAGLRFNITQSFLLKASYERGVRFPVNAELFGDGALITPAIFLKPEIAKNNNIGFIYDRTNADGRRLQIEANGFFMNVDQLIQLTGNGLSLGYVNYAKAWITGADVDVKSDITDNLYGSVNLTWQKLTDRNRYIPGTAGVANPTFGLALPNTPRLFGNVNLEYHRDDLIGKKTRTRIIYDGSYFHRIHYGFEISVYDDYIIPSYINHTLSLEQAFDDRRYTLTFEANNILNERIINNYNQPLAGRTFRLKFRYLLLGKKLAHTRRIYTN